jgi:hypothetical protein
MYLQTGTGYFPKISGHNNYGFTETLVSNLSGTDGGSGIETGPTLRTNKITALSAVDGGTFAIESVNLDDDASGVFSQRGQASGKAIYIIATNYSRLTSGIFTHDGTGLLLTAGSSDLAVGDAANPDTDGKVNIWKDADCINVKNRMGTAIVCTLVSIG